jgi:predicted RNA-binding protein YlqC (UPF0109 family)
MSDQNGSQSLKRLIEFITRELVDHQDDVVVTIAEGEATVAIEVRVHPEDVGKVIGKGGQTAKAIRKVLHVAAAKHGKTPLLKILE